MNNFCYFLWLKITSETSDSELIWNLVEFIIKYFKSLKYYVYLAIFKNIEKQKKKEPEFILLLEDCIYSSC